MGVYLNPGKKGFSEARYDEIYVDKSNIIRYTNEVLYTDNKCLCVTRPRRFGKSTDAQMLVAYYDSSCDSMDLFQDLNIAQCDTFKTHLNQHRVFFWDVQSVLSEAKQIDDMIELLNKSMIFELVKEFPNINFFDKSSITRVLQDIYVATNQTFIFVIDEWDCIFREKKMDKQAQEIYLDYLRMMFKGKSYVSLVYMTGILPIKKYGTHSALNMFDEFSMISPKQLTPFVGFTEKEVHDICDDYHVPFDKMKAWYDGYHLNEEVSIYSPRSVIAAALSGSFENYWNQTETFEALKIYIDMNFDGLKDTIINLLAGQRVYVDTGSFQNDMTTFHSKDDVLTLLIHLGYLGYDQMNKEVYIPNREVSDSFIQSIKNADWGAITQTLRNSQDLLLATWNQKSDVVAASIERAHLETSFLQYNDENALAYTIYLAYITARNHYTIIRELSSGKGFADLVFLPLGGKPAMIIELKWNQECESGIRQIKEKKYRIGLEHYLDRLLLVSISYDKKTKEHMCIIERYEDS